MSLRKRPNPSDIMASSWLVTLFIAVCILGCTRKKASIGTHPEQNQLDSIATLIANGRDAKLSIANRTRFLQNAWQAADKLKGDSVRLRNFSRIQWSFLNLGDSLRFRKTNQQTRALAEEMNDSLRIGFTYWDLGEFQNRIGVKDSAYFYLSKAQKLFASKNDILRVGTLSYDLANIQTDIKDYTGAEINTIKAIELLKPLKEDFLLFRCYNLLGILAKDLGEYERSLAHYETARTYLEKTDSKIQLTSEIENNIGVTYREMGNYEKAVSYFKKVLLGDSLRVNDPRLFSMALSNLALSSRHVDSDLDPENLFLKSLQIRDSIKDMAGMAGSSLEFARFYLNKNDSVNALNYAKKAKLYAEESLNNERLLESLELLAQLEPSGATGYAKRYARLNDSLQKEERKTRNKFARIRFETDEVVAENQSLARQNQLWTGIAATLLLLGVSIFIIITQRAKNQKLRFDRAQQANNEKVFNLMLSGKQKLEEGRKLEQKRISEELHDSVLGKMLGARMVLTGLNKKNDREAIDERATAISALKQVESEVRSLSHKLSNAAYEEVQNFIRSIEDLLKNVSDAAKINHTFNYTKDIYWDELRGDIKINVYRMVQESLQNAIKHSKCKNLSVDFSAVDGQMQVLIEDDGVGFDFQKRKKGIGMRNIRSRIEKIGGTWRIKSSPGKGTTIRLSVPIVYYNANSEAMEELNPV